MQSSRRRPWSSDPEGSRSPLFNSHGDADERESPHPSTRARLTDAVEPPARRSKPRRTRYSFNPRSTRRQSSNPQTRTWPHGRPPFNSRSTTQQSNLTQMMASVLVPVLLVVLDSARVAASTRPRLRVQSSAKTLERLECIPFNSRSTMNVERPRTTRRACRSFNSCSTVPSAGPLQLVLDCQMQSKLLREAGAESQGCPLQLVLKHYGAVEHLGSVVPQSAVHLTTHAV